MAKWGYQSQHLACRAHLTLTARDTKLGVMKSKGSMKRSPTLDLHGYKTDEVFDAVEAFLKRYENEHSVRIMPGKGTGKVKSQVIEYLKLARYHWSFEKSDKGVVNDGVMIVFMQ